MNQYVEIEKVNMKSRRVLVSWIGDTDLKSTGHDPKINEPIGPIASTLETEAFDAAEFIYNYPDERVLPYLDWLKSQTDVPVNAKFVNLSSPTNFSEIYLQASKHLSSFDVNTDHLSILLSPGTPAMQAVWILLGKTRYACDFYQSSIQQGVQKIEIPFELSAEYIPAAKTLASDKIGQLTQATTPIDAAFDNIITRNPRMLKLKAQAQVIAEHDVPVLIYGETGTGKELFARAIHNASNRAKQPFIALNCGAIPSELVDSVLFGHKKGAFTGATADKPGVFEQANGGSLFLDEFGELEANVQVRLLRVLQEGSFTPVGGTKEHKVDVRLITATHRNLMEAVSNGTFREDLFYRIAVGVLHLPPLREREGDLLLLADSLLEALSSQESSLERKIISPDAKNLILKHSWKGNVRELQSTLLRALLWCEDKTITSDDIRQALFQMPEKESNVMNRDFSQGVDIQRVIGDIVSQYIRQALEHCGGNKTNAAKLLGLKSYQNLNNWMEKYGIS
ncbi:sigma 54-interacting transcriptional regulator [Vibrio parahaemolyticus]|nr:sigma 54-interacting transcriptional regulator [Vibrio parahaemolyticus]